MPTVTFNAIADTWIDEGNPNSAAGWNDTLLRVALWGGKDRYSYVQFDFSSIPAGATITSAAYKMTFRSFQGDSSINEAYFFPLKLLQPIDSGTTWNTRPGTQYFGVPQDTIVNKSQVGVEISWDIKEFFADISNMRGVVMLKGSQSPGPNTLNAQFQFASKEDAVVPAKPPQVVVTYTTPPTKPTLTAPNGGETYDQVNTVAWTASTDPTVAQSALTYEVWASPDNGISWTNMGMSAAGVTSQTFNFVGIAQSSQAKVRVRAYNGSVYSPFDESDGVFTISHNTLPTAPTGLSPSSGIKDKAAIIRFAWQHHDPQNDPQTKFDLQWRAQGSQLWNTISQTTANQFYDMPVNTITADGMIEWQVRTYDNSTPGPWSTLAAFQIGAKPATPTITSPATGSVVGVARPVVQWTSTDQASYEVQVRTQGIPGSLLWTSGEVISTNKALTVGIDLVNGTAYNLRVLVKNSGGIWSDFANSAVTVSFTPPAVPVLTPSLDTTRGSIAITIDNPAPTGSQPSVSYNDIYRRIPGGEWLRIATGVPNNGAFVDYTPASAQVYDYYVKVFGLNGTFTDSAFAQTSVKFGNTQLSLTTDYSKWAEMVKATTLSEGISVESSRMKYAGRKYAVTEFGPSEDDVMKISYLVLSVVELDRIKELVRSRKTLLLRDSKGRRDFVTVDAVDISETSTYWQIAINPEKVEYTEGV